MRISDFEDSIPEISRCCEIMERPDATFSSGEVKEAHGRIVALLAKYSELGFHRIDASDPKWSSLQSRLRVANEEVHIRSELEDVRRSIRDGQDPFERSFVNPGFRALMDGQVNRWLSLGFLDKDDSRPIVVVGGGALPISQIFFYRQTGMRVISVERRQDCAEAARALIDHLGYTASLEVVAADGCEYDYRSASLIVVAAMVSEKLGVAARVLQTSPESALTMRTPFALHSLCRTPINETDLKAVGWRVEDSWFPDQGAVGALTCRSLQYEEC